MATRTVIEQEIYMSMGSRGCNIQLTADGAAGTLELEKVTRVQQVRTEHREVGARVGTKRRTRKRADGRE